MDDCEQVFFTSPGRDQWELVGNPADWIFEALARPSDKDVAKSYDNGKSAIWRRGMRAAKTEERGAVIEVSFEGGAWGESDPPADILNLLTRIENGRILILESTKHSNDECWRRTKPVERRKP